MTARRVAREIAVILMPQLPKTRAGSEALEMGALIEKTVRMLADYAKQNLLDAGAILEKTNFELHNIEAEHPDNSRSTQVLHPVALTTEQLREQIAQVERALHLVAEALDVPEMTLASGSSSINIPCKQCGHTNRATFEKYSHAEIRDFLLTLLNAYSEHKVEIDEYIKSTRSKWNVERMVSIDRDILRLACAEAFFIHEVPINVAISEAVELCHRFADEKAAKFVNGVLADLSEQAKEFRQTGEFPQYIRNASQVAAAAEQRGESLEETKS
ncbi:MAG TPA: transcription antitermination factor NusB [Candidatus Melainabacteria bacterium]|jgi:transcription antitermination factor NusB|nr:transcription antitermination factor NusB [Candidatus Melainabacteria bacterium]HIN65420.1 transcription antitermination factor NusB [Candidatus Obscuribacterales bacterium]